MGGEDGGDGGDGETLRMEGEEEGEREREGGLRTKDELARKLIDAFGPRDPQGVLERE